MGWIDEVHVRRARLKASRIEELLKGTPKDERGFFSRLADCKWEAVAENLDNPDYTFGFSEAISFVREEAKQKLEDFADYHAINGRAVRHVVGMAAMPFVMAGSIALLAGCSAIAQPDPWSNANHSPQVTADAGPAGDGGPPDPDAEDPFKCESEALLEGNRGDAGIPDECNPVSGEGEGEGEGALPGEGEGEGEDTYEVNAFTNADRDGYGAAGSDPVKVILKVGEGLPDNLSLNDYDCDDGDGNINPDADAELCNDKDMDCNGNPYTFGEEGEEGFTSFNVGSECYTGVGACEVPGALICDPNDDAQESVICYTNSPGQPSLEACDAVDNDCDGQTDEEIDSRLYGLQDGVCRAAVEACAPEADGTWQLQNIPNYEAGQEISCDGLDNDCDGEVDDNITRGYGLQDGVCDGAVDTCVAGDWVAPVIADYDGGPEIRCDNMDNDCDGIVDEGITRGYELQDGVCADALDTCETGDWVAPIIANYEGNEISCDGLDNDCDGQADNGLDAPLYDGSQNGVCAGALQVCYGEDGFQNDVSIIADYEAVEISCDGLDNDCDGRIDVNLNGEDLQKYCGEDRDRDGFGNDDALRGFCAEVCPAEADGIPYTSQLGDRDDRPGVGDAVFPGATEYCDGLDNNQDGDVDNVDQGNLGLLDNQQGVCEDARNLCIGGQQIDDGGAYSAQNIPDYEMNEVSCDGLDNNCDGLVDYDSNGDPLGVPTLLDGDFDGSYAGSPTPVDEGGDLEYHCAGAIPDGRIQVDLDNLGTPDYDDNNEDVQESAMLGTDADGDRYAAGELVETGVAAGTPDMVGGDCQDDPLGYDGIPDTEDDGRNIHPGSEDADRNLIDNNCDGRIDDGDFAEVNEGATWTYTSRIGDGERQVTMTPYNIAKTEITNDMYARARAAGLDVPDQPDGGRNLQADAPATQITLTQARDFCDAAYTVDADGDGVPEVIGDVQTWAHAEYAATHGDGRIFPGGNEAPGCGNANYQNCVGDTVDVASYDYESATPGVRDQAGNASEFMVGDPEQAMDSLPLNAADIRQSPDEAMTYGGHRSSPVAAIRLDTFDSVGIDAKGTVATSRCVTYANPADNGGQNDE
jgi:hypothetical protein